MGVIVTQSPNYFYVHNYLYAATPAPVYLPISDPFPQLHSC